MRMWAKQEGRERLCGKDEDGPESLQMLPLGHLSLLGREGGEKCRGFHHFGGAPCPHTPPVPGTMLGSGHTRGLH